MMHRRGGNNKYRGGNRNFQSSDRFHQHDGKTKKK